MSRGISVLFLFILFTVFLQANKLSEEELTVAYVYKLSKNITWNNKSKHFTIHLVTSNTNLINEFKKLAKNLSLHSKKIIITSAISDSVDKYTNVVFVSEKEKRYYDSIFYNTLKYPILLISNDYNDKNTVMINLIKTKNNTIDFEINRANILSRNLKIKENLILLGGTELDVAYLYRDTINTLSSQEKVLKQTQTEFIQSKKQLENEKKKLLVLQSRMKKKEKILLQKQKEIKTFNQNILTLQESITKKNTLLHIQEEKLTNISDKLTNTQTDLTIIESTIAIEKVKLKEDKIAVFQKEKLLQKLAIKIKEESEKFEELHLKVEEQNKLLNIHEETIHEQKNFLTLSSIALLFFILVVFIITYLLKKQSKTYKLLASTQEELRIAKEASDKANNNKSIFIANMSHELRTPLNAVLGYTHLLQKDKSFSNKHQKTFKIIQDSGQHLLELINDILLISKMEAGFIETHMEVTNLFDFINSMYAMFDLKSNQKGIYLKKHIADDVPEFIITDIDKVRQIFINLLSNAVKFTNTGGIDLSVSVKDSFLMITVKDSGIGVAHQEIHKLFLQYQQTQSGISEGHGTGLGLALVKQFLDLLEGEITVKSELGVGTTFSLKIPYIQSENTKHQIVYQEVLSIKENQNFTILVVDDVQTSREILVEILELANFHIRQAKNGLEALESVKLSRPDIILMDLRMPVMCGKDSAEHILELDKTIPIICITASIMGMETFLNNPKPFVAAMPKPFKSNELFYNIAQSIDVEYVYEDNEENNLSFEELSLNKIPAKDKEELLDAVNSMNITVLEALITNLSEEYTNEKHYMEELTSNLDFETFKNLLES